MSLAATDILDIVAARLALIDTANGYSCTPLKIERGRMAPWQPYDLPAVNYWPTSVGNTLGEYGMDERRMELFIEIHAQTQDEPFCDVAERLAADIVTAVNRSTTEPAWSDDPDYDIGGSVTALVFNGYDYEIGQGQAPWCGALVKFEIVWQTTRGNMEDFEA